MTVVPHSRPWITDDDIAAVQRTLAIGMIGQGRVTAEFEATLSSWVGGAGGVATASGSGALTLALRALACGPGDEVILPTYTCRSVLEAVESTGAHARFCDVGEDGLVHAESVRAALTEKSRAVVVPHMYGLFADTQALRALPIPLIEDFAQALGDRVEPMIHGRLAVYSFHPTKCLTTGEGGMVVATDPSLIVRLRKIRDGSPHAVQPRLFAPLSDLNASLGLAQLRRYAEFLARRRHIAERYTEALARGRTGTTIWTVNNGSMYFRYPIRSAIPFDQAAPAMADRGVTVRRGVDELLHRLRGLPDTQFPTATHLLETTVCLPIHPSMTEEEIGRCVSAVSEVFFDIS